MVLRNGKHVGAVPPDYRLLDYNPETHQYLHANMQLSNASFRVNQEGMVSARASLGGGSGVGDPASYPSIAEVGGAGTLRGLSVALSSEAQSVPDGGTRRKRMVRHRREPCAHRPHGLCSLHW